MKKLILLIVFAFYFQVNAQTPIQEFKFDGTLSNTKNSITFSGEAKFVEDRTGVANNAQRLTNATLEISIWNLPQGNTARTVSIWVKYNDITAPNYIWGYGASENAKYYGLLQQRTTTSKSDLNLAGWGPGNDAIVTAMIALNSWYNYTVTYDGLTSKIYRNGELIKSTVSPRKLTSGIAFGLGKMGSTVSINADIDDLKIYDFALTYEQVTALYNEAPILAPNDLITTTTNNVNTSKTTTGKSVKMDSNSVLLSSTNKNVVLSVPMEITRKSVEIFSEQGQKVITTTKQEVDISNLAEGTYLLKITNTNKRAISKKAMVN